MTLCASLRTLTKSQTKRTLNTLKLYHFTYHTNPPSQSHAIAFDPNTPSVAYGTGNVPHARHLLDKSTQEDLTQYNHLLFEYSRADRNQEALHLFVGLNHSGLPVEGSTLSCVLKVCGCLFEQNVGRQVHCQCIKSGFVEDVSVGTALVDMYMKTENVGDGRRVFDEMGERNVVSWTSLLAGYARNGLSVLALELFFRMQVESIKPNPFTFATIFGALADDGMVEKGIQLHSMVIKNGFESTMFVCNSLISMYSKSGMVGDARAVFDSMENRNEVSWNGMVAGYLTNGCNLEALKMFYQMRLVGLMLTQVIFATMIKLCANLKELGFTRQLHCRVLKNGYGFEPNIRTALMVAYSKCNIMDDVFQLFSMMHGFQNVVSWTAMISGYLQNGGRMQAVNLFCQMNREVVRPNHFTYSTILTAQPAISIFQVHAQVIKTDYEKSPSVGTALLDAYIKIGYVDETAKVFELLMRRTLWHGLQW